MISLDRIESYKKIFGSKKMLCLWQEYLEQATKVWENINEADLYLQRSSFHNWRTSSLVFGMEDFARRCSKIEEDIMQKRLTRLPQQISECRECYNQSVALVGQIMQKTEADND